MPYTCQRFRLYGFLLLLKLSPTYSATASRVVTQLRPIFFARRDPRRARRPRCFMVNPLIAAASAREIKSSFSKTLP